MPVSRPSTSTSRCPHSQRCCSTSSSPTVWPSSSSRSWGCSRCPLRSTTSSAASALREWCPASPQAVGGSYVFMESFSIFGGNIKSTLAGEFSFGWSFALSLVYLGMVVRDTREDRGFTPRAGIVLALTALTHIVTTLVVVVVSLPLLIRRKGPATLVRSWLIGFAIAAFWALPLGIRVLQGMTSDMNWSPVRGLLGDGSTPGTVATPLPNEFIPIAALGLIGLVWTMLRRDDVVVLAAMTALPFIGYWYLQLPDVELTKIYNARLLPYWYLGVFIFAGLALGLGVAALARYLPGRDRWLPIVAAVGARSRGRRGHCRHPRRSRVGALELHRLRRQGRVHGVPRFDGSGGRASAGPHHVGGEQRHGALRDPDGAHAVAVLVGGASFNGGALLRVVAHDTIPLPQRLRGQSAAVESGARPRLSGSRLRAWRAAPAALQRRLLHRMDGGCGRPGSNGRARRGRGAFTVDDLPSSRIIARRRGRRTSRPCTRRRQLPRRLARPGTTTIATWTDGSSKTARSTGHGSSPSTIVCCSMRRTTSPVSR